MASINSALTKDGWAILSELPTKPASFLWCADFGVFFLLRMVSYGRSE